MPYSLTQSLDHAERGLAKLLEQFKGKPRIEALLRAYLNRVQELENAAWEVINYRLLENAEGVQQDIIGRIVGRGRNALSDTDYFYALKGQIRINRSSGRPEDLIDVTRLSIPSGFVFSYGEFYPATVIISISGAVSFNISILFENLLRTKAGGVRLFLSYSEAAPANTFTFASGSTPELDTDQGFGDINDALIGGVFSGVLASSP